MSRLCFNRMQEYQLTPEILNEVFQYGRNVEVIREGYIEKYKIEYAYDDRLITVIYTEDPVKTGIFRGNLENIWYVLITCWVQKPALKGGE